MKSLKSTMIVLAVSCLAMACYTLAQGGVNAGSSTEASIQPIVPTPSQSAEPVPPTPPPSKPDAVCLPTVGYGADVCGLGFGAPEEAVTYAFRSPTAGRSSSSSRKVLVIPDTEIKTEDVAAITQEYAGYVTYL